MTNQEAIIAAIGVTGWQEAAVCKAMIDLDITANALYVKTSSLIVNTAALQVLRGMLGLQSIQEGGYSITYALKERIAALETETGISGQPKIRNASYKW
jgi:hypothetical protein